MTMTHVAATRQPQNVSVSLDIAEQIMLRQTTPQVWLEYIKKTGRGRWLEAEDELLERFPWRNSREAKRYAEDVIKGRWRQLEAKILTGTHTRESSREVLCYTRDVVQKRWKNLETHLLECYRSGSGLVTVVDYASTVINGRWKTLEHEFLSNSRVTSAEVLYKYACNVIKGRLPEDLHNLMLMKGLVDSENEWLRKYLKAKKYQQARKPR